MLAVKYEELSEAFHFVSFAVPFEHQAFLDRTTGKIYWVSEGIEEEVPEDLYEADRYIAIPHRNDLDLGTELALCYAATELPGEYARIEDLFRHRGAYARFKESRTRRTPGGLLRRSRSVRVIADCLHAEGGSR